MVRHVILLLGNLPLWYQQMLSNTTDIICLDMELLA